MQYFPVAVVAVSTNFVTIPHATVYVTGLVPSKDAVSNIPPAISCFSISVTFLRGAGYPLDATFVVSKSVFADRITPFLSLDTMTISTAQQTTR